LAVTLFLTVSALGQFRGRGFQTTWLDDTHYLEMQKDKSGKDVMMSVDAATGKAKQYKGDAKEPRSSRAERSELGVSWLIHPMVPQQYRTKTTTCICTIIPRAIPKGSPPLSNQK
jgi:hypothetical protein